jgi:hypothetical protein
VEPLAIPSFAGWTNTETPDYTGKVAVLSLLVPVTRIPDLSRNDALRRELADLLKNAIPQENA